MTTDPGVQDMRLAHLRGREADLLIALAGDARADVGLRNPLARLRLEIALAESGLVRDKDATHGPTD